MLFRLFRDDAQKISQNKSEPWKRRSYKPAEIYVGLKSNRKHMAYNLIRKREKNTAGFDA